MSVPDLSVRASAGDAVARTFAVPAGATAVDVAVTDQVGGGLLAAFDNATLGGVTLNSGAGTATWTWAVPAGTPPGWYTARARADGTVVARGAVTLDDQAGVYPVGPVPPVPPASGGAVNSVAGLAPDESGDVSAVALRWALLPIHPPADSPAYDAPLVLTLQSRELSWRPGVPPPTAPGKWHLTVDVDAGGVPGAPYWQMVDLDPDIPPVAASLAVDGSAILCDGSPILVL